MLAELPFSHRKNAVSGLLCPGCCADGSSAGRGAGLQCAAGRLYKALHARRGLHGRQPSLILKKETGRNVRLLFSII
jgi:hypothetical protein